MVCPRCPGAVAAPGRALCPLREAAGAAGLPAGPPGEGQGCKGAKPPRLGEPATRGLAHVSWFRAFALVVEVRVDAPCFLVWFGVGVAFQERRLCAHAQKPHSRIETAFPAPLCFTGEEPERCP